MDGPPPSLSGMPRMGTSPVTQQSGNPGLAVAASAKVREAIQILQNAMPDLPVGTPMHKDVIDCVKKLTESFPPNAATQGIEANALRGLAQDAGKDAGLSRLMAQMPNQAAGGGGMPAPPGGGM